MEDLSQLSDDGLRKYFLALTAGQQGATQTAAGAQAAADTPDWQAPLVASGRVFDRLAAGARAAVPESMRNVIDATGRALGMAQPPSIDKATQDANTAYYAPLEKKNPGGTFGGELATSLAMTPFNPAAVPLALAAQGGLEYGTPTERATRAAISYAGGKAGQWLGAGVNRLFGPASASTAANTAADFIDTAGNKWGIPVTMAQASQSKPAQIMESVLANLPGSSGVIAKARDATYGKFNQAVSGMFGENANKITPEMLGAARDKIGGTIGAIADRNAIMMDQPLFQGLQAAAARTTQELTPEEAKLVQTQLQHIWNAVDPQTGQIPGTLYKAYQSMLGKMAKTRGGTVADVLGDVRSSLRDAMTRSVSKEDSAAWLKANEQYFNLQQVANAGKATPGELSPTQLLARVNEAQKSAKFGGGNDLADLARWGKMNLPDKIPNSGTAQRQFYQQLLQSPLATAGAVVGGGYAADKAGFGPELAASVPLAYGAARFMAGRPNSAATEELLKRLGGGLLGQYALGSAQ